MVRPIALALLLAALCSVFGGCVSVSQTSAPTPAPTPAPTLSPRYPVERLPLPEGSVVGSATAIVDGDNQSEYLVITLPMKKSEAISYFKPLLEKDAEFYTESESDIVPLEIQGAYPDAKHQVELFARYAGESALSVMRVNIFMPADGDAVTAVQIQLTYR